MLSMRRQMLFLKVKLFVSAEIVKSVCVSVVCSEKLWGLFILMNDSLQFIVIQSNVQ